MTKKRVYWYGIRTVGCDLSIVKGEVVKETPKKLYFSEDSDLVYQRGSMLKSSSYERWFPTRAEAVTAKLKMLKRDLRNSTKGTTEARTRLKKFREQENG
jgi:hypothetical protein